MEKGDEGKEAATVNYVAWSKERGFYYSPDGAYARREDYERLQRHVARLKTIAAEMRAWPASNIGEALLLQMDKWADRIERQHGEG